MGYLDRKMRRDLWRMKGRAIASVLLITMGSMLYVALSNRVVAYDVSDPGSPVWVTEVPIVMSYDGGAKRNPITQGLGTLIAALKLTIKTRLSHQRNR